MKKNPKGKVICNLCNDIMPINVYGKAVDENEAFYYLTITQSTSRRRRGDYKLIFAEPRSNEVNDELVITEPLIVLGPSYTVPDSHRSDITFYCFEVNLAFKIMII